MGDSRWRERLTPVQDKAVTHLAGLLVGDLIDKLFARRLLTESQYNVVLHDLRREPEETAARHLLTILRRCPDPSFSQFCEILLEIEGGLFLYQCLTDEKDGRIGFHSLTAKPPSEQGSSEIKPTQATPSTSQRKKAEQNKEYYQSEHSTQRETQERRKLLFLTLIVALIAAGTYFMIAKLLSESEPIKPQTESSEIKPTQATPPTSHRCEKIVMEALDDNHNALAKTHPLSEITLFGDRTIYIVVNPYMPTDNPTRSRFEAEIREKNERKNKVKAKSSISEEDAATKGLIKFCQMFRDP